MEHDAPPDHQQLQPMARQPMDPQHLHQTQQQQLQTRGRMMECREEMMADDGGMAGQQIMEQQQQHEQHLQQQTIQHQTQLHTPQTIQQRTLQPQTSQHQSLQTPTSQHQTLQTQTSQHQALQPQTSQHQTLQTQTTQHQTLQTQVLRQQQAPQTLEELTQQDQPSHQPQQQQQLQAQGQMMECREEMMDDDGGMAGQQMVEQQQQLQQQTFQHQTHLQTPQTMQQQTSQPQTSQHQTLQTQTTQHQIVQTQTMQPEQTPQTQQEHTQQDQPIQQPQQQQQPTNQSAMFLRSGNTSIRREPKKDITPAHTPRRERAERVSGPQQHVTFEMVKSERGFDNVVYQGYRYRNYRSTKTSDHLVWRCCMKGCNAKAETCRGSDKGVLIGQHNHRADTAQREVEKRVNNLRFSIGMDSDAKSMIQMSKTGLTADELAKYPQDKAVRSMIWRRKRRISQLNGNAPPPKRFSPVRNTYVPMFDGDQQQMAPPHQQYAPVGGAGQPGVVQMQRGQQHQQPIMSRCEFQNEMVNRLGTIPVERRGDMRAKIERELDIMFSQKVAAEVEQVFDEGARGTVMERLLSMITD